MSHLFSPIHRKQKIKPLDHELYHGNYCERMYAIGMKLSAEAKELEKAIRYKRNSIATLRKNARRDDKDNTLYWQEVHDVRNDDRPLHFIRSKLAEVTRKLVIVKFNYQLAFLVNRDFSMAYIAGAIHFHCAKHKIQCGDSLIAASTAIEKVRCFEQLYSTGLKIAKGRDEVDPKRIFESDDVTFEHTLDSALGKFPFPVTTRVVMAAKK